MTHEEQINPFTRVFSLWMFDLEELQSFEATMAQLECVKQEGILGQHGFSSVFVSFLQSFQLERKENQA